jgi:hypothetical protein
MFENNSLDFPLVLAGHSIAKRLRQIKVPSVEPVFTFFLGFSTMNMNRFVRFVSIEKEAPPTN